MEGKITAQRSNASHHRTFDRKYYDLCCAHLRGQRGHHHGGYFSRHQYQVQKSKVIKIAGIILSFFSLLVNFIAGSFCSMRFVGCERDARQIGSCQNEAKRDV